MAIAPLPPIGAVTGVAGVGAPAPAAPSSPSSGAGFANAMERGLQGVSDAEHRVDAMMTDVATGGSTSVHELMVATSEASLATDVLVNVRDRAVDAYHEIMRMQL